MFSLISIRVKYLIRHPCLLFWSYLFLPLVIIAFGIYSVLNKEQNIYFKAREKPYNISELQFFNITYEKLNKYWNSTLFIVDKKEDCEKIEQFFINENILKSNIISCSNFTQNISNETENIIKIEKDDKKYRIYLTSRKNDLNETNKEKNVNYVNFTEYDDIIEILNYLNLTNFTKMNEVIDYLKGVNIKEIMELFNISQILPFEFPGIFTVGDIIDLIISLNDTNFNNLNKIFNKDDLNQDQITNAFYVNNGTISNSYFDIFFNSPKAKYETFFEFQSLFAKLLITLENKSKGKENKFDKDFKMTFAINSYPDHYRFIDKYGYGTYSFLSFVIALQFSLIAYNFNLRMIDEKENKLNILLERQGISKFKYNSSWLITYYSLFSLSIVAFIIFLISYVNFHYSLVIINIIVFSFSIYCVCIFFTTCIKSTKEGATAIKFYNFGSILLGFVIVLPKTSKFTKIVFCFIPQINIYSSLNTIFNLNNFENLTWDLLKIKAAKMSMVEILIMYIVEIIFYLGLSIFIQSFSDSGLNFIQYLTSFFKKVSRKIESTENNSLIINDDEKISFETHHQELSPINQELKKNDQCLRLVNISKTFGDLKAVDNFNGELFPNEIFCLLGHNGAGKSTTINMISGILDPDNGDIFLNGRSLVTNKSYLYENIGLCQQQDIFFDYLTVEEHLQYMCRIKGSKINNEEIEELIDKIELAPKKNALCSTLSGGQKRKLCIALALIGDSKIILLDEPTSGMDVMARRSLWEFLKNYKKDKIILLTTHFLDEAEYLGDRIGIMSEGKYLCSGTSSFLKSKYPCGFNINLLINSSIFNEEYKNQFFNGIKEFDPNAEIKVASKGIFSINIQSNNQHIPEIFDYIEEKKNQYGIADYTVSSTSLEDVFLKINNKANLNDIKYLNKEENKDQMFNYEIPTAAGFFHQLGAQIIRGLYPFYRNKVLFFFELLSGLGFVYMFIFFFSDFIINATVTKLNLIEVLEAHKIYYSAKNIKEDFIENSHAYNNYITLKNVKGEIKDFENFSNITYDQALGNIAKGGLYINKADGDYEVYNSEVDNSLNGYLLANTMLFFSAFLKEEYSIDASIFPEIDYSIIGGNTKDENLGNQLTNLIVLVIVCLISLFGFVIFLGGLMYEKIKEKRTNIKHLLYLSGSNIFSYWIGFFIVDYIKLLFFNVLLISPIFYVSGSAVFFGLDMLSICLSSLSFIYFISFFCPKDDDGAKILFLFVFGFLIIIGVLALLIKDLGNFRDILSKPYTPQIFDLTPITSMGLSFIRLIISYTFRKMFDELFEDIDFLTTEQKEEMVPFGLSKPRVYLFTSYIVQGLNFIFYTLLLILAESGVLGRLIHNLQLLLFRKKDNYEFGKEEAPEEFDEHNSNSINATNSNINIPLIDNQNNNNIQIPVNQNTKIANSPSLIINNIPSTINNPLDNFYVKKEIDKLNSQVELSTRIENLVKTFYSCCGKRNVRAINHLYLGLEPNEKFGLLGFNGSGKTTTFRAITNEILTDTGSVSLFGYSTKSNFERIRTMIGYCPQINPLFDFMKVKEIIKFYSDLKTCNESVETVCHKFGLEKYLDTYTINLSGGNKRKLTFAIAMMNRPSLLLLDEPSTGVDPESRRIMWRNINELSNTGHQYNMILTTHSMEEAEILCDTVSWFKAGNFITKGNPEELKIQYSAGYKLHIKFDDSQMEKGNSDTLIEAYNIINSKIIGFSNYYNIIIKDIRYEPYLRGLNNILEKIKDKIDSITLYSIGKDYSFELIITIIKEKQKDLFIEVLNMKNKDNTISEMNIAMQSLENILTSLN